VNEENTFQICRAKIFPKKSQNIIPIQPLACMYELERMSGGFFILFEGMSRWWFQTFSIFTHISGKI